MASGRPFNQQGNFLPNGTPGAPAGMNQNATTLPTNGRLIQAGGARVLCVADVRGNLKSLNELARAARADHIIHTGDFGFYDDSSLERVNEKTLKHVAQYSPLLSEHVKKQIATPGTHAPVKSRFQPSELPLSELPEFLSKRATLDVPVYTVWGACEDVRVLEKFRSGEYKVNNLHIIDEANSRLLDVGGVKLRLLGLGGAVVMHKLFDNGEGRTTIAGGGGTMWTTLLQMGELVDTANRVYDPAETRVFVTHASPAREGLLNQLSVTLKADFSISAGLHFRYGSSYNEFSVNPSLDHYRGKLAAAKASFNDVWETVKSEVEPAIEQNEAQKTLLSNALDIVNKMPEVANSGNPFGGPGGQVDEAAFKNMWNFNLADAAFGWLVLEVEGGRIGTEMKAQGFNFAHRGGKVNPQLNPALQGGSTSSSTAQSIPTQPRPAQQQQQQASAAVRNQQPPQQAPQQSKPQPGAPRDNTSPAASGPSSQVKPATPQPGGQKGPAEEKKTTSAQSDDIRNGTAKDSDSQKPVPKPATSDEKPALFIGNTSNIEQEDGIRALFSDEDKAKITRLERHRTGAWVVHFKDMDETRSVLSRHSEKRRFGPRSSPGTTPHMKIYREHNPRFNADNRNHRTDSSTGGESRNAGHWGARSGSDGESARGGRGGRGNRGAYRGERGGRGGRGGAGAGRGGAGAGGPPSSVAPTTGGNTTSVNNGSTSGGGATGGSGAVKAEGSGAVAPAEGGQGSW